MKVRLLSMLMCAFLVWMPSQIEAREGAYGGFFGGLHINNQGSNFDFDDSTHLKDSYDTGALLGVFAGYRLKNNFRGEIEIAYRENAIDTVTDRDTSSESDGMGKFYGMSVMANFYRDVRWETSNIVPFWGLGLGFMRMEYENESAGFSPANTSDEVLAYQVIAGLSYERSEKVHLFADYRYFGTQQPKFTTNADVNFEGELHSHATNFGIRWMF